VAESFVRTGCCLAVGLVLALCLGGCGGGRAHGVAATTTQPRLVGGHACPGIPGFTCASLSVPLDHGGSSTKRLTLQVGAQNPGSAPRGVLLFLTGGPGQPGIPLIPRIRLHLGAALDGYRLVMLDQRGTGAGALDCPALQTAVGSSDLALPPAGAVAACGQRIGTDRRFFTTPETVADIDELRRALGATHLTLDGVSYGTFVAERYALAYPDRVTRLVLDSVVPQQGVDPLYLAAFGGTARVLRSACAQTHCGFDPADDVATIVRTHHDGPALLNAIVAESIVDPDYRGVLGAVHAGADGDMAGVQRLLAGVRAGEAAPADFLSQGLHESTLCLDLQPPWNPAASTTVRARDLGTDAARVRPSTLFPYDRATAAGNGLGAGCAQWPSTTPARVTDVSPRSALPSVPVLLLAGDRDLSTPLDWAREEARQAPRGHLLVVPDAGHSVQTRAHDPAMRRTLLRFLGG
jgi:pimeloyl-ACP methyl ester carboxylesterase